MVIILLIIILLIILSYIIYNNINDPFLPDSKYNVGNELGKYFIDIAKSILNRSDFNYNKYTNDLFFKDLRNNIKKEDTYDIYSQFTEGRNGKDIIDLNFINSVNSDSIWTVDNTRVEYFWLCMKPLINTIYKEAFVKNNLVKNINKIVIHFRCADVPFTRQGKYHFQKYKFFKDALNSLKTHSKELIILYNNSHLSDKDKQESCDIYVESLKNYLIGIGYNVTIQSESQLDDFATIFYAPAVISTSSSYSFMSGFFSDGTFITSVHYASGGRGNKCAECTWQLKGYDLEHEDVVDYYDTDTIITQLNNN